MTEAIRTAIVHAMAFCRIVRCRLLDRAPDEELTQCAQWTEGVLQEALDEIDHGAKPDDES